MIKSRIRKMTKLISSSAFVDTLINCVNKSNYDSINLEPVISNTPLHHLNWIMVFSVTFSTTGLFNRAAAKIKDKCNANFVNHSQAPALLNSKY